MAYEMTRQPVGQLLGQPVAQFTVDTSKRSPRQLVFYSPQMVRLPPLDRMGPQGSMRIERTIKILPVGAISITVRVPFSVERLDDLVDYHDLHFSNGSLTAEVRQLAEDVRRELAPYFIRPVERVAEEEGYPVFCIESSPNMPDGQHFRAESWFNEHRREVASLLMQEANITHLSDQEVLESTDRD